MESLFKFKCYENGYAELSEKVTFSKTNLPLKRFLFWKSSCSEEVPLRIITYSGEKAPSKQ